MRRIAVASVFVLLMSLAACSGRGQSTTAASPSPETTPAPGESAQTVSTAAAATTAAAGPIPTPNPNLLSIANGTVLRSYAPVALDSSNLGNIAERQSDSIGATPPYTFVFELPGVATVSSFGAALPPAPQGGAPVSVSIAVSTTGAGDGFSDAGTMTGETSSSSTKSLPANVKARWVRVTANGAIFSNVSASGTIAPPPAGLDPAGIYIREPRPEKNGMLVTAGTRADDNRAAIVRIGSGLTATGCRPDRVLGTFVGPLQGRIWNANAASNGDENSADFRGVVNDDASIIAGTDTGGNPTIYMRTSEKPPFCVPRVVGTGAHHVLVLDQDPVHDAYPLDSASGIPGYTFTTIAAGMLDAGRLNDKEAVVMRGVCTLPRLVLPEQIALLLNWTAAGHKLLVVNAGCAGGADLTWLPYALTSPGSGPAATNASLIEVENDAFGTNDRNDAAHYVDVAAYVQDANQRLHATLPIATTDSHWCGHFFVAKTSNVNGFVQTYASDGKGMLVYDGFSDTDDGNKVLRRIRELELAVPVGADLPCSQHVTDAFLLQPSQEVAYVTGKAQRIGLSMQVLANQAWSGHTTVKTSGDLPATVSPSAFDIAGGTQHLDVYVNVPASQKPGVSTVDVIADNGSGKTSQASISLTGTPGAASIVAVKKQYQAQKRIRVYGIHFDVDSAHIQPRSEPVITDIAQVMHETPGLRFQVEGHTDSDGGATYNLGLSQRRAQAVVEDLVTRHDIARSRLTAKGYGLTKPVAPNTTSGGKALNRRVELLKLS